jgi:RecB family exonuclease
VRPVRDTESPIHLSGSGLDGILTCSLKWFLEHEVNAETPRGTATAFGSVVHAVADFVAKDEVPADLEFMDAEVDRIWSELRFEAAWQSAAERAEARAALSRFLVYHQRADRELIGAETRVRALTVVATPDGPEAVKLTGFIDRVERDSEGRLVPIDLKNMRFGVRASEVPEHGQLGVYQLMLREGGLTATAEENGRPEPVGGAALVQLRLPAAKDSPDPKVQFQDALGSAQPTWVEVKIGDAAHILRAENFVATVGQGCRYCAYKSTCPAFPSGQPVTA